MVAVSGHGVVGLLPPSVLSCSTPVSLQPNLFLPETNLQGGPEVAGLQSELMQAGEWYFWDRKAPTEKMKIASGLFSSGLMPSFSSSAVRVAGGAVDHAGARSDRGDAATQRGKEERPGARGGLG